MSKNPFLAKTYEIQLSPDCTFQDLIEVINALKIRFTMEPSDTQYNSIMKHALEVTD